MFFYARLSVVLLLVICSQNLFAANTLKPGLWSGTVTMEVPGMPMAMPSQSIEYCVTKEDAIPKSQKNKDCKFTDKKTSGNTTSWTMVCDTQGNKVTAKGKMTYTGDSASGVIDMTVMQGGEEMQMKQTIKAKRIGDCK